MELTVLHLLLILIGISIVCTIGYQYVSNVDEAFVATNTTKPTCPKGLTFAAGMGACYDPTNKIKTVSAAICPAGSNFVPGQNLCVKGASPPPPNYWVQGVQSGAPAPAKPAPAKPVTPATTKPATVAKPAATAGSPTCYDPNGNVVSLTSLVGLSGASPSGNTALSTEKTALPTCPAGQVYDFVQQLCVPTTSTKPICPAGQFLDMTQGLCITNIPAVPSFSSTQNIASSKASDSTMLQNIDQIVRNELLRQKGMTTGAQIAFLGEKKRKNRRNTEDEYEEEVIEEEDTSNNSPSNYQGKEFTRDCPKNRGNSDMSEYVRKDSIPCWGCNIE